MNRENPGQLPRAAARRQLAELRIESIQEIVVEEIAALRRLFVVEGELNGAEGRSVTHEGAGIIRIHPDVVEPARRRFVIAHEIGHCVMHKTGSLKSCGGGDLFRYDEGNREAEANWFAAELLMPAMLFRPFCDAPAPTFEVIRDAARTCQTTLTATSIRFVQLSPERCSLVWSEDNRVKWSVPSPDFPGWIAKGRTLSRFSHASDVFQRKPIPLGPQPVPQHAWLDREVAGGSDILEETLAFGRLGAALTLLWFPADDDVEPDDDEDVGWRR